MKKRRNLHGKVEEKIGSAASTLTGLVPKAMRGTIYIAPSQEKN